MPCCSPRPASRVVRTSKDTCRGRVNGMSHYDICVRNTFLDTWQNTDGSRPIIFHRCRSAPAVLTKIDLDNQHDDSSNIAKSQVSILLAHVLARQEEEERTSQALCEMKYLNHSLDIQVSVTRQRCYVTTILLCLIRDDGNVCLHTTWRTFYSCCARYLRITITQLMFRIYGALIVRSLRKLYKLCRHMDASVSLRIFDIQTVLDALAWQTPMQILILETRCHFRRTVRLLTPGFPFRSCPFYKGGSLFPFLWSMSPLVLLHPGYEEPYVLVCNPFG